MKTPEDLYNFALHLRERLACEGKAGAIELLQSFEAENWRQGMTDAAALIDPMSSFDRNRIIINRILSTRDAKGKP